MKLDPGNTKQGFFATVFWYGEIVFNIFVSFVDVDECVLKPSICGTAVCKNIPGDFECECAEGYKYNPISKSCDGKVLLVLLVVGQVCLWWWGWGSFSRLITCASLSMHTYCWNALAIAYFGEHLDINAFSISTRKAKDA